MIHMTLDCVGPTQSCVTRIVHRNVGLKCFSLILSKCLFAIIVIHLYFIYFLQGSVEMHLWCSGIYNNCLIANCLQTVPVKGF